VAEGFVARAELNPGRTVCHEQLVQLFDQR